MGNVFWVQMGLSFCLWIALGAYMARGSDRIRAHSFSLSRSVRGVRTALLFALSPIAIFVPVWIIGTAGGSSNQLSAWAWAFVTVGGLCCVACATMGSAYAVSLAMESADRSRVTTGEAPASSKGEIPHQ